MATSIQIIAIFFLAVTGLTCNFVKASFKEGMSEHFEIKICSFLDCYFFSKGECKFCYSLQPLTTPDCNPYSQDKIQLNCKVKGPLGAELDIKWFFKSKQPEGTAMELENIAPFGIHKTIVSVNNTVLIKSDLAISNLTVGEYWCQVYHMDNALLKSQIFGVATKGDYSRDDDCAENVSFSVESEKCADIGQNNKLEGESYTCPLTQSTIHSPTSQLQDFKTRTLIPSVVSVESTLKLSQNTNSRIISPTLSPQSTVIITSQPRLLSTNHPSSDPAGLMEKPSNQLWLYVVVGLSGVFLFLIFVLTIVFVLLCLTGPRHHRKRK